MEQLSDLIPNPNTAMNLKACSIIILESVWRDLPEDVRYTLQRESIVVKKRVVGDFFAAEFVFLGRTHAEMEKLVNESTSESISTEYPLVQG